MLGPLAEIISTSARTHAEVRLVLVKVGEEGGFLVPLGANHVERADST